MGSSLPPDDFNGILNEEEDDGTQPPVGTAYAQPSPPANRLNPMRASASWFKKEKPVYSLHVRASKRNTIATFTSPAGEVIRTYTGGSVGFKHGNRSSYEAGHQCTMKILGVIRKQIEDTGSTMAIHLYFSGFGNGREAVVRALQAQEGSDVRSLITTITDKTPIKIGGTRAMKVRRL